MQKRVLAILMVFALCCVLAGCWGKEELNEVGIVVATGIDKLPDGQVLITVLSVSPVSQGTQGVSERSITWVGTAAGSNIADAARLLRRIATKRLSWDHNSMLIIGEEMAKAGIKSILDYFVRSREIRLDNHLLICEKYASDLLLIPADIEKNLYTEIKGLITNSYVEWSLAYVPHLKDFITAILGNGKGSVAGRIGYNETTRNTYSTNREMYKQSYKEGLELGIVALEGSTAFKDDRFAGWLSASETRGYTVIMNKARPCTYTIKKPDGKTDMTVCPRSIKTSISSRVDGGRILMTVKVAADNAEVELGDGKNITQENVVKSIERAVADIIRGEMKMVVGKAQESLKTDIFGFGDVVFREHPDVWRDIGGKWEEVFPEIEVNYEVEVKLKRFGLINEPIIF